MKYGHEPVVVWEPRQYTMMKPICQRCRVECGLEDAKGRQIKVLAVCPNCKRSEVVYDHAKVSANLAKTRPKAR